MQEDIRTELISTIPRFDELERTPDSSSGDVDDHEGSDEDDFEFTFEGMDRETEWFPPGEVFPIFDRKLLSEQDTIAIENDQMRIVQSALKKLFIADDQNNNNNPTDETDQLTRISPESYCVWTPGNSPQASPARCKKSSSTGTSTTAKRWGVSSLKELLIRRSRSDGEKTLGSWKKREKSVGRDAKKGKEAEKRRATYLPYRKAIIGFGFYPSVNGFGGANRSRPPF